MAHRILTIFTYIVFGAISILPAVNFFFPLDCKSIEFPIKIQISRFYLLWPIQTTRFNLIKKFNTIEITDAIAAAIVFLPAFQADHNLKFKSFHEGIRIWVAAPFRKLQRTYLIARISLILLHSSCIHRMWAYICTVCQRTKPNKNKVKQFLISVTN